MTAAVRLRLSRAKGFRLQEHSRAVNGLPAIAVARPSRWGNPFRVAPAFESGAVRVPAITVESAVALHREQLEGWLAGAYGDHMRAALAELRGHNLACWCALGAPCHADVLLALAHAPAVAS